MTHTDERQPEQRLHPPGRLEAFGDGVFAIAITLLVLEIAIRRYTAQAMRCTPVRITHGPR